jgi:hypothetical protein
MRIRVLTAATLFAMLVHPVVSRAAEPWEPREQDNVVMLYFSKSLDATRPSKDTALAFGLRLQRTSILPGMSPASLLDFRLSLNGSRTLLAGGLPIYNLEDNGQIDTDGDGVGDTDEENSSATNWFKSFSKPAQFAIVLVGAVSAACLTGVGICKRGDSDGEPDYVVLD